MKRNFLFLVSAVAWLLLVTAVPQPVFAEVRDAADYFSDATERRAEEIMQHIRQRHGKDVVVETVPAMPGTPAPGTAREEFFEREVARRGKEAGVNGVYVLVSRDPQSFYVGVDPQTQKVAFTLKDRGRVRDLLLDRFKAKDFDGGLTAALEKIDQTMAANAGGAGQQSSVAPPAAPRTDAPGAGPVSPRPTGGACGGIGGIVFIVIGAILVFAILRAFTRRRLAAGGPGGLYQRPGYDPRTGQPIDPRYGHPGHPQQQSGGGLGTGLLGGVLGGMAGGYLYDKIRGGPGGNEAQAAPPPLDPNSTPIEDPGTTSGFADFGSDAGGGDIGGGDYGGGGDSGGGGDF